MNKLALKGKVWIASDIHLGPDTPATALAFQRFLNKAAAQADALILCGDIFDAWIGDDFATSDPPPWLANILAQLREVSAAIPLWLGRGNRDFLIGARLARHVGAQLLPDVAILETDAGAILLSHGDEYCLADPGYRRFRRIVRNPFIQALFLRLSLKARRRIADWARQRSMAANRSKPASIMDVTPDAVAQAFRRSDINTIVHGHTHRPQVHRLNIAGRERLRIVLPDWDYDHGKPGRSGWLAVDANGIHLAQQTP